MERKKRVISKPSQVGIIELDRLRRAVGAVHVIPAKDGWTVKKGGRKKVVQHFSKKADAVMFGMEVSRRGKTGMYVHSKAGRVEEFKPNRTK